jgi:hypothetical protein
VTYGGVIYQILALRRDDGRDFKAEKGRFKEANMELLNRRKTKSFDFCIFPDGTFSSVVPTEMVRGSKEFKGI